ncbi:hypothetical protein TSTA_008740 [Talaromyces stipitatus ATCC 10500]|uniref:Reverse transcriptase n=1 Tax=Talaromyces stipitatus (strain ATCC 10500 / CBS 375.48 / QM 6759 / NRRL 1006) TaxID=441959 RepID=B8MVC2_TALSN|nr:uncharacterized protein TSTA_008740 [Talaromyces stipitatus ATCC 10500]EED11578.1 hypothetical protein TSTA_008740 [Talaromyces stipitatus ATCC 10500]
MLDVLARKPEELQYPNGLESTPYKAGTGHGRVYKMPRGWSCNNVTKDVYKYVREGSLRLSTQGRVWNVHVLKPIFRSPGAPAIFIDIETPRPAGCYRSLDPVKTGHAPIGTYRRESPECQACKELHGAVRHVLFECRGRRAGRRALYRVPQGAEVPLPTAAEENPEARLFAEPSAAQGLLQFVTEVNLFKDKEQAVREAEISDVWGWDTLEEGGLGVTSEKE